jgi:lipopolysaccharide export system protein LptA
MRQTFALRSVTMIVFALLTLLRTVSAGDETVITAGSLAFDYKMSTAVLIDDVIVNDPRMNIRSDRMTVVFEGTNALKSVTAAGNVKLWDHDKQGSCEKAVYNRDSGEVVLTGQAKLQRGRDVLHGNTIRYWVGSERVVCEPARLVVYPQGEASPDGR